MLRFRLQQLHLASVGRYLVPLPKLGELQAKALALDLESRGFRVATGGGARLTASKGRLRISIEPKLGLAGSSEDILDGLGPSIPAIFSQADGDPSRDVSRFYFSMKRSSGVTVIRLFPRMESSTMWTSLRRDGLSGLVPDEASALKHLLSLVPGSTVLDCVTSTPKEGSRIFQSGRRQFFKSRVSVRDFIASLRTIDSKASDPASYLPRDSIIRVPDSVAPSLISAKELGEWCLAG